jgi:hypothetical protein
MPVFSKTPAMTKVASEYNYISSLDLAQGLHKPEVDPAYIMRYGRQDITGFMAMLGNMNPINAIEFHHYEQDRIHGIFRLSASAASAAAGVTPLSATAASAYNYNFSGDSPYPTAQSFTTFMPSLYDIIEVKGWQGIVTAVTNGAITITPVSSSEARPAIATTDDIIILGNAMPEGSGAPESRNSQLLSYSGSLQIQRRTHRVTNTEMGVKTWIEVEGKDGQKGYFWYLQGINDEYHRFLNEREAVLLAGRKLNTPLTGSTLGSAINDKSSIVTTEGLIPQISGNGNVASYSSSTGLTLSDVEDMVKELQKYRGSRENMLAVGHNLKLGIDAIFRGNTGLGFDAGGNGGVIFNAFNGVQDQALKLSFDAFEYGGFKFAVKTLDIFSDPNFLGYAGGIYKDLGMVIPMDDTVTYNNMNSTTGVTVPSLRINYLQNEDGGRDYREWVTGYGMGAANTNNDFFEVNMLSHTGLEAFALNRFGLFVGS